ncbi:hypothetical protein HHI36_000601 [Cryptolaemus montrouzieri]|uniref:Uncharacterized protein n=1 Tax=Cryptolaemus montrouzieri TaxID=559131 RepID=A0ABD2P5X2_9CUCU
MTENDHPKVIVDDDFLDLRNPQPKSLRRRPISAQSKNRDSSSITTQGRIGATKDVLPGLQRLLSTYNQKTVANSGYKRGAGIQNQPVDSRFRRKVEKKALSSKSASLLQEKGKSDNGRQSSEITAPSTSSSESEKKSEAIHENPPLRHPEKPSKSIHEDPSSKHPSTKETSEKIEKFSSRPETPETKIIDKKQPEAEPKVQVNDHKNETKNDAENHVHIDCEKQKNTLESENKDMCTYTTSHEIMKSIIREDAVINRNLQKLKWYDPTLFLPHSLHSIPSFKKSWTIPSLPHMKRDVLWARHYNALCTKVDRKTYEFDADETDSIDSDDRLSNYSSLFRKNYMNAIFCLGCLCGLSLVAGILTASEIQNDLFKPAETTVPVSALIYRQIVCTLRVMMNGLYQLLTFPSKEFFKPTVEPPKYWGIF